MPSLTRNISIHVHTYLELVLEVFDFGPVVLPHLVHPGLRRADPAFEDADVLLQGAPGDGLDKKKNQQRQRQRQEQRSATSRVILEGRPTQCCRFINHHPSFGSFHSYARCRRSGGVQRRTETLSNSGRQQPISLLSLRRGLCVRRRPSRQPTTSSVERQVVARCNTV